MRGDLLLIIEGLTAEHTAVGKYLSQSMGAQLVITTRQSTERLPTALETHPMLHSYDVLHAGPPTFSFTPNCVQLRCTLTSITVQVHMHAWLNERHSPCSLFFIRARCCDIHLLPGESSIGKDWQSIMPACETAVESEAEGGHAGLTYTITYEFSSLKLNTTCARLTPDTTSLARMYCVYPGRAHSLRLHVSQIRVPGERPEPDRPVQVERLVPWANGLDGHRARRGK